METRLYIVTYDVRSPKRWRRVYKTLKRRGAWQQLSAFVCRLTPAAAAKLERELLGLIDCACDRLMIADLGADADDRLRRYGSDTPLPLAQVRIF